MTNRANPRVFQGDIDQQSFFDVLRHDRVAWDIETTGLDWRFDKIGTCQLHGPYVGTVVVQLGGHVPHFLRSLLKHESLMKVFHHAPFDLRFMCFQWKVRPENVACTKVASKIADPGLDNSQYSLRPLLLRELGVKIDKAQQRSDWVSEQLTDEQLAYAAADVEHLIPLLDCLREKAAERGVLQLVEASFTYLPVRVELDLIGVNDAFSY